VFQGSPQPAMPSVPRQGSEIQGRNHTERCPISSLMRYFCEPRRESPAACAGCKLCPQDWQLHGDRCYWLSKEQGNWIQGKEGCENRKSQLVVLQDKKEMEYIKNVTGGSQQPVWIGLVSFHKKWRWVNNTPLNTKIFGRLQAMDEGCGTLKGEALENSVCDDEHKWVCQKDPFQLSP
ncbi:KRBBC protein, partial [Hydrobates tethys]|nr:KRBBC protein [Oceanodroma tethys]